MEDVDVDLELIAKLVFAVDGAGVVQEMMQETRMEIAGKTQLVIIINTQLNLFQKNAKILKKEMIPQKTMIFQRKMTLQKMMMFQRKMTLQTVKTTH